MEFIRPFASWDDFHQTATARETFQKLRTAGAGEQMIIEANAFVERVLPSSVVRHLSDDEMAAYRAPFPTPESRRRSSRCRASCRSPASQVTSALSWKQRTRR